MKQEVLNTDIDFQLISEELTRIFTSTYLDDIDRKEMFVQRSTKLKLKDFVFLCAIWNKDSGKKSLVVKMSVRYRQTGQGDRYLVPPVFGKQVITANEMKDKGELHPNCYKQLTIGGVVFL